MMLVGVYMIRIMPNEEVKAADPTRINRRMLKLMANEMRMGIVMILVAVLLAFAFPVHQRK